MNPRPSPNKQPVRRPIPQHASPAMEGQKTPRRPSETTHQYLTSTFALNRRYDTVRSPHPANSARPGPGASPYKPPSQANPVQRPLNRDAEKGFARPGPNIHHNNKAPARNAPVGVSLRGGGSEVGSARRNNPRSPAAARIPARHPSRRLSSASPSQTHLSPRVPDEVRAMDAEECPNISPEEMDVLRQLYIACQQHPEKFDEYRQQYAIYQQQLRARKGLSGGKSPGRPQFANTMPQDSPRPASKKPVVHQPHRAPEQAQFRPAYSPQNDPRALFRGGITSPSNTPGATRERPVQPFPNFNFQQSLPDTPQTGGNHQRKRSGPIPRIILKVPKRAQLANKGRSPVKEGNQAEYMKSPRKNHYGSVGGKTLEEPPVDESGLVVIDD